ncbi:unnamed protein product, partial [Rotaria magnacalcarata]
NGSLGLNTIKRWCKIIRHTGSIQLSTSPGAPRLARASKIIEKVKHKFDGKEMVTTRRLATDYGISKSSAHRILTEDLKLYAYNMTIEPKLTEEHKNKRKRFVYRIGNNIRKEDTMRALFSDEKMFDLDGIYNSQNQRIWVASRDEADEQGGIKIRQKFPEKVMVWLGACSKGVTPLVILGQGTVDHVEYIEKVLPIALKYGNDAFGKHWIFSTGWCETSHSSPNTKMVPG